MLSFKDYLTEESKCNCWKGYKRKPGTAPCAEGSCIKEEVIDEAVTVDKKSYSWGKMVTVHHGKDTSYPLHPEHQDAIKKLRPGMKTSFKDETGRKIHAHREGDQVHLVHHETGSSTAKKTTVGYHHFEEATAVDAKGHKSSTGGLTQKGRDYYNRKEGGNLKAPVTTPPSKLDPDSKAAKRRKSFCARMSGVDGPMKKPNGEPTRKALALRKWNC